MSTEHNTKDSIVIFLPTPSSHSHNIFCCCSSLAQRRPPLHSASRGIQHIQEVCKISLIFISHLPELKSVLHRRNSARVGSDATGDRRLCSHNAESNQPLS